jgi:hydrogenase maturation protease
MLSVGSTKTIIIGIGNILFYDDGLGVIAAKYLEKNYSYITDDSSSFASSSFEILDGGTLGFTLLEYFTHYDNVFILDTLSSNEEIGSIYKIPAHALLGGNSYKNSAHEVEVLQMLEACELYEKKAEINIFAMIPKDIHRVEIGLSEVVKDNFISFIETIVKSLKFFNIKVSQNKKLISVEAIIKELQC